MYFASIQLKTEIEKLIVRTLAQTARMVEIIRKSFSIIASHPK